MHKRMLSKGNQVLNSIATTVFSVNNFKIKSKILFSKNIELRNVNLSVP